MRKISTKLLIMILPIMIFGLVSVVVCCIVLSIQAIGSETGNRMLMTIESSANEILTDMRQYEVETSNVALTLGQTLSDTANMDEYDSIMENIISENELVTAMGYFIEPGYYQSDDNCYSYLGEENGTVSKAELGEFDYTASEWYVAVRDTGEPYYCEPYVDENYGILMISYVEPIFNSAGRFVGAVNTDIDMSSLQSIIEGIQVGTTGKIMLLDENGAYLTNSDASKIMTNIADDTDSGLATIAENIMSSEQGRIGIQQNDKAYRVYFERMAGYNWVMMIVIEQDEVYAVMDSLVKFSAGISVIAIAICALVIFLAARKISLSISAVKDMSTKMAGGDFSMEPMRVYGKDEVAQMTGALNDMLEANRNEMKLISNNSNTVGENCEILEQAVIDLEESFEKINQAIQTISSAMMDNSATTEELTASVTEVKETVINLANKASESEGMSKEIMQRAQKIGRESNASFDQAMDLSKQYEKRLQTSIENSKVVNEIGTMADAISEIAEQINLLSLNASIEAARAGEQGKGFAVVAGEIGNLANQTSNTVTSIQNTVSKVKESVETLSDDSKALVDFISQNVTPDYRSFVDVSQQYENDADSIQELSSYLADIASQLKSTMEDVNLAIQNIAVASQDAAEKSTVILENVDTVSGQVENVGDISTQQKDVSHMLDNVVGRYKLD